MTVVTIISRMSKSIIIPPAMPAARAMIVTSLRTVGGAVEEEVLVVGGRGVVGRVGGAVEEEVVKGRGVVGRVGGAVEEEVVGGRGVVGRVGGAVEGVEAVEVGAGVVVGEVIGSVQ